ncbi:MAG: carbon-nitrogen hydrolase family protein [Chloroflexia bacterium]|nr:carbon-nitrogen hydrolase family protein [Chloroflexia bacterium]
MTTSEPNSAHRESTLSVALVQMNSGDSVERNVIDALAGIDRAAAAGARLVVLPEVWTYLGADEGIRDAAEPIPGPLTDQLAGRARQHGIYLHIGSIYERVEGEPRLFNTSVVYDPQGAEIARYRKIHLFDVDLDAAAAYHESATIAPGEEIVTFDLDGISIGLAICYDLRFPELFRILALRGADVIILPAAFTLATGKDHWEPLLRARAIENSVYLIATNQVGQHPPGLWCYGRSMVVDPWGLVTAQATDQPTVLTSQLDLDRVRQVRRQVPSLSNRLPDRYAWPEIAVPVGPKRSRQRHR